MSSLPSSWASINLLDCSTFVRGVTYTKGDAADGPGEGYMPLIRANNIQSGKFDLTDLVFVPGRLVSPEQALRVGDVAIATSSGSISVVGKAAQVRTNMGMSFGAFCGVLRPSSAICARYFGHFFTSKTYRDAVSDMARGVNINNLKRDHFQAISLPLAPEPEQRRIADKLDTVLARVDAVNDRLARVAPLLKRFRQSVLAAATSGKLTEEWREVHAPQEWLLTAIGDIAIHISDGPFGSNLKSDDYTDAGARVVRLENIGHLVFHGDKETYVSIEKYQSLQKHTLQPGDLLFSSFVDEEVRVCEFPAGMTTPAINKADCFCVRLDAARVHPQFVMMRLASRSTYETLKDSVHGATRPRINLRQLRALQVQLPGRQEQDEIVRRVELLFGYADRLEARLQAAQTAADRLTPALLAKAFRGELVPQDPNDEPASELLKRLTAQTPAAASKPRGRPRSRVT